MTATILDPDLTARLDRDVRPAYKRWQAAQDADARTSQLVGEALIDLAVFRPYSLNQLANILGVTRPAVAKIVNPLVKEHDLTLSHGKPVPRDRARAMAGRWKRRRGWPSRSDDDMVAELLALVAARDSASLVWWGEVIPAAAAYLVETRAAMVRVWEQLAGTRRGRDTWRTNLLAYWAATGTVPPTGRL